ncbi:MAG: hypothetical protein RJB62_1400 [Pseudomonadota bacterium]|jgi:hypothetical protein
MWNLFLIAFLFIGALAFYRWGGPIRNALKRFDARNRARQQEEFEARFDAHAHYRQTLRLAEEQFEEVTEVVAEDGTPRFLFGGEEYFDKAEAEAARRTAIVAQARAFYVDLDTIYLGGRPGNASAHSGQMKITRREDPK